MNRRTLRLLKEKQLDFFGPAGFKQATYFFNLVWYSGPGNGWDLRGLLDTEQGEGLTVPFY